jgi:hypothetical protein
MHCYWVLDVNPACRRIMGYNGYCKPDQFKAGGKSRSRLEGHAMQSAIVMLLALSGLGCQNGSTDSKDAPVPLSPIASPAVTPLPTNTPLPPYPRYFPEIYADVVEDTSRWACVRSTLWSFVLGRDPDVMTPAEIEDFAYGFLNRR